MWIYDGPLAQLILPHLTIPNKLITVDDKDPPWMNAGFPIVGGTPLKMKLSSEKQPPIET